MIRRKVSHIKTIAAIVGVSSVVFVVFGGISVGYSMATIAVLGVMGALFGAIAVPELEPSAFRYPTLWQISCSVAGSLLVALMLESGAEGYLLAILSGTCIGYLAPFWIKHIVLP
ncbi:hypothetical protein LGN17_13150 [Burkholderia sp. AU30280]|uniref:hypothetical protein n=1 Tax=unclassified Burkholderia TaxID=2613784 RepID=UPI001CF13D7B|nr:hypothetical protein [Burkholderia sp. AU30280]MCA8273450.1 hypothetical protein [Burkholderia sp. AU30280]